jgi:hypothetical protein
MDLLHDRCSRIRGNQLDPGTGEVLDRFEHFLKIATFNVHDFSACPLLKYGPGPGQITSDEG